MVFGLLEGGADGAETDGEVIMGFATEPVGLQFRAFQPESLSANFALLTTPA